MLFRHSADDPAYAHEVEDLDNEQQGIQTVMLVASSVTVVWTNEGESSIRPEPTANSSSHGINLPQAGDRERIDS